MSDPVLLPGMSISGGQGPAVPGFNVADDAQAQLEAQRQAQQAQQDAAASASLQQDVTGMLQPPAPKNPGGVMIDPTAKGVGYDPGVDDSADPYGIQAGHPDVGPVLSPGMSYERAYDIAGQGAHGGMTGANIAALREYQAINERNAGLKRGMGDRIQALGEAQGAANDDAATKAGQVNKEIDKMDLDDQAKNAAQMDQQRSYQKQMDASQKDWEKAVKDYNPSRMFGSAGFTIGATIAAALGALGQGLLKQNRNSAYDIINDALERDMDRQRVGIQGLKDNVSVMQQNYQNLRQLGVDEHTARLGAKGNALDSLGRYMDQKLQSVKGDEARVAASNLRDTLYMEADEAKRQAAAMAAKPNGKVQTEADRVKAALELQKSSLANRKTEVETQAAELKAEGKSGEDKTTDATLNRRSKLAEMYEGRNSAVQGLQTIKAQLDKGTAAALQGLAPNLTNSQDLSKNVQKVIADYARGRGGPITAADQQISEQINDILPSLLNPSTWSDGSAQKRVDALLNILSRDRDGVFKGQNAEDVRAIKTGYGQQPAPDNAEAIVNRLKAKRAVHGS